MLLHHGPCAVSRSGLKGQRPQQPMASPWVSECRLFRPARAKASMRQVGFCPCRALAMLRISPGRRPGLRALWPFRPSLLILRNLLTYRVTSRCKCCIHLWVLRNAMRFIRRRSWLYKLSMFKNTQKSVTSATLADYQGVER